MRIIILGTAWTCRDGQETFRGRLAQQLRQEGHEVEVVSLATHYHLLGRIHLSAPYRWCRTARYIRQQRPDLLLSHYRHPVSEKALAWVNRLVGKGVRRVALAENRLSNRSLLRSLDGVVALTRQVLTHLQTVASKRYNPLTFCPLPVNDCFGPALSRQEALSQMGLREKQHYVLFFGFIRDDKGLDLLLQAMADERMVQMGVKLIVAGEFQTEAKPYIEQIKQLDISDRVVMHTEFIPDDEVSRYFCAADLVVLPYREAVTSDVAMVAFHYEKPLLVTRRGDLPEIVPDGKAGFVVEPDAEQLADAIATYFNDYWPVRLTEGLREEKQKYSWENITQTITSL